MQLTTLIRVPDLVPKELVPEVDSRWDVLAEYQVVGRFAGWASKPSSSDDQVEVEPPYDVDPPYDVEPPYQEPPYQVEPPYQEPLYQVEPPY